jgi:hypothetical protein
MLNLKRSALLLLFALCAAVFSTVAFAQNGETITPERMALARELQKFRPAKLQTEAAIDRFLRAAPPSQQDILRTKLNAVINYKALDIASVDAYAEIYTEEELRAMIAYYGSAAGKSASEKSGQYAARIYPQIIQMLDKALMDMKTGN